MQYKKVIESKKAIKDSFDFPYCEPPRDQHNYDIDKDCNSVGSGEITVHLNSNQDNIDFLSLHPGHRFTKLSPLKNWLVPMTYYDGARLCSIFKL